MKQQKDKERDRRVRTGFPFWAAGLLLGAVLLTVGALDGQLYNIYRKAVMICLECIGIG